MADRPILFSAPMVLALLREASMAGTGKTQTRRILKPQIEAPGQQSLVPSIYEKGGMVRWKIGDRLWVREAWRAPYGLDYHVEELGRPRRPAEFDPSTTAIEYLADGGRELGGKDRSSLHMPRWASRLTLLVTAVRIQQLHDISEADAEAEGCGFDLWDQTLAVRDYSKPDGWFQGWSDDAGGTYVEAERIWRASFRSLWESINGPESWQANPWVVVVGFTVHARNIDQLAPVAEVAA